MAKKERAERSAPLPKGYGLITIVRFCFLILIVVLLLWMVYTFRDDLNIDNFMRFVSYLDGSDASPYDGSFRYSSSPLNRFVAFKNGLAAASPDGLAYYNPLGRQEVEIKQAMGNPAVRVNDRRVLAYDIGGKAMLMSSDYSVIMNQMAEFPIINARLNEQNWFALVTSDDGYKAGLTVYNSRQAKVFRWQTSESYILDADLSPDSKRLAACAFRYQEGEIVSKAVGFELNSDQAAWEFEIPGMALSVNYLENNKIALLGEHALIMLDSSGREITRYDFEGMTLRSYSDEGEGVIALLFTRNRVGSLNLIVTLDYSCGLIGERETDEMVSLIRARGGRVATLSPDGIKSFGRDMVIQGLFPQYSSCVDVGICADGKLLAISQGSAVKILE